ncbi:hypothetical protein [Legionella shakespearei]|uniref:Uncharacterized protein n=1 Tax=Legionella shakespearei DSM 23087 TaxID=1122169 RepID=A0A0W0Z647_9GAMM|nr:hypothetical protein [Legionella shakespearei]KTD64612.1 hypothetical protein Lsha_0551 [Legionella shakespearei DSM 23087]
MFFSSSDEPSLRLLPSVHHFPEKYIAGIKDWLTVAEINSVLRLLEEKADLKSASDFFKDFSSGLVELGIGSSKQLCFSYFLAYAVLVLLPDISNDEFKYLGELVFLEESDFEKINESREAWYMQILKI